MELIVHGPHGTAFIPTPVGMNIGFEHGVLVIRDGEILVKAWAPGSWFTIELQEKQA
jgi:hypothetical protein